jgi:hypothetical protein
LSPFTALSSVAVRGWGGLIAGGSPHYLLWRGLEGAANSVLGLSFGGSIIHPRTVSKRIPPNSEWFEFGRGPGYADFQDGADDYEMNHPVGRYVYRYSLSLETDPIDLARESNEWLVPPWVVAVPAGDDNSNTPLVRSWLSLDNNNLFLSGCEWLRSDAGRDVVRVRIAELNGREVTCTLQSYRIIEKAEQGLLLVDITPVDTKHIKVVMPPYGVRELILTLGDESIPAEG